VEKRGIALFLAFGAEFRDILSKEEKSPRQVLHAGRYPY
jgi:hypothetical protein